RLGQNFNLDSVLEGDIEPVVQACITQDQQESLERLAEASNTPTSV
ncbi:peptide chain release factor 1, partial [Geitlerinema sp. P-1104]|nr:peptide chain release factor 1 [Geitlerinema sp. P-1104]